MKMISLIAQREYAENVKTKGFWLTIAIFPIIFAGMYFLQSALSRATPERYYILIDQSGQYEQAVDTAIEREHQRRILQAFVDYLLEYRLDNDLENTVSNADSSVNQLVDDVDADEVAALNDWIDNGGLDYALLMASPYLEEDAPPFEAPPPQFRAADLPADIDPDADLQSIARAMRPYLAGERLVSVNGERGELFALILIPDNVDQFISRPGNMPQQAGGITGVQYWSRNLTDSRLPDAISNSINSEIRAREYLAAGIDAEQIRTIQRTRLPFSQLDPTAEEGEEAVSMADTFRQYAPLVFVYLMFVSLMQNVQYLLSNTIEEKSNRIIEVLLASVTADELMLGKLLGIAMAGLTTIAVWLLSFFLFINLYDSSGTELIGQVLEVILSSELIPWFVFYYFAGYALYSGVFLAIGSLCSTLKEAQALMMPMILIQIVPLAMMAFVIVDPNNSIVRAMSWFPLFTPYLMMNRAAGDPPMVDVVGTTILLLLSIALVLWGSGKVFRQGVLRTGQAPKLIELWRMLRARSH
ncbi:MAG: ABC transporter permease [Pseudomonadales bacterium]|nr:ABC transporter permease [Pseudomonadales bacterium]